MGFAADISSQVRKDTSHHLAYPPGVPIQLGDVMVRDAGIWIAIANLYDEFGIERDSVEDATPGNWSPTSERGFDFEVKAAGEPSGAFKYISDAKAGVKVTLSGKHAFALSMKGVRFRRVRSVDALWKKVLEKQSRWTWDLSRRFVTRVVEAERVTFLASGEGDASFELEADADVEVGKIDLVDLSAGFTLKSTFSAKDQFVGAGPMTPLFGAHKMRLLGTPGPAEFTANVFEAVTPIEDDADS